MKKEYLKPETEIMEMEVSSMIATSAPITDEEVDAASNERRGRWGNLWSQD